MLKKFTEPYKHAPAKVSTERIDAALEQGAQAEIQSSGRIGYKSTSLVTLRTLDGRVIDSWPVQGNVRSAHAFVASYNRTLAARQRAAPPQPPPGYPQQQGQPPYPPRQPPPDTTGWTTQLPRGPR